GTAVLSVTSSLTGASYKWYNDNNSNTVIATGDTLYYGLTTDSQNPNKTYTDSFYVSVVDPLTGCESVRSKVSGVIVCTVNVNVNEIPSEINDISIYPNPSKGIFHIVGKKINGEVNINIYNTNGKM